MQVFELDKDLGRPSYSGIPFFKTIRPLILAEHLSEAQFFQSVSAINNVIAYRMQAIRAVRLFFIFAAFGCFIGLFVMVAQVNQPRFPLVFIFPLLMMFCLLIALMVGNWWLKQCIQRVGILLEELTRESGGRLMWRHEFRIGTKYAPGVNSIRIEFLSNPMPNIQAQQHFAVGQLTQMPMPASAPFYSAPRQEEIAPSNPPTYVEAVHEVDVVISTDKPMSCENQAVSNGQYLDNSSEGVVNAVTHDKIHDACRYEGEA